MAKRKNQNWIDELDEWNDGSSSGVSLSDSSQNYSHQRQASEEDWDDDPFLRPQKMAPEKRRSKWIPVLITVLVLLLAGVIIWLSTGEQRNNQEERKKATQQTRETEASTITITDAPATEEPVTERPTEVPTEPPTPRPTKTPIPSPSPTPNDTLTPTPAYETMGSEWYDPNLRYYYFQLTERERTLFALLYSGMMNFRTSIPMGAFYSEMEIDRVYITLQRDCPELFQVRYAYTIIGSTIYPEYRLNRAEYEERSRIIHGIIDTLRREAGSEQDEFIREFRGYRYVVSHCRYRIQENITETADSCLVDGEAQCSGYAKALMLVLRGLGIQCFDVASATHEWTMVKINRQWYQCDATWDSKEEGEIPDLESSDGGQLFYLNVPDRLMKNPSHQIKNEGGFTIPACTALTDNYAVREGIYLGDNIRDCSGELQRQIQAAEDQGAQSFVIMMDNETAYANYKNVFERMNIQHGYIYSGSGEFETRTFYLEFLD